MGYHKKLQEALYTLLDAADNDDLPDGAWWQNLEDTVEHFNKVNQTDFDPNAVVHSWVEKKSKTRKVPEPETWKDVAIAVARQVGVAPQHLTLEPASIRPFIITLIKRLQEIEKEHKWRDYDDGYEMGR